MARDPLEIKSNVNG